MVTHAHIQAKTPSRAASCPCTGFKKECEKGGPEYVSSTPTMFIRADTYHFSDAYLSKLFIKHLGKSFSTVLRDVRMDKAARLLTDSQLKIYKISKQIGYSSVDHFSRAFKKTFGMTPKKYQLTHQYIVSE